MSEPPEAVEMAVDGAVEMAVDGAVEMPVEDPDQLPGGLRAALEAVLMVVDAPVSTDDLAEGLGVPAGRVASELAALAQGYRREQRGFELRSAAGGWRIWSHPRASALVARFTGEATSARLSKAALETLAVIAYTQPVTRARVAAVRGVDVDSAVRTLATRGLVTEVGREPSTGAALFRTTTAFLEKIGVDSLEDLPALAPHLPAEEEVDDLLDAFDDTSR